MVLRIAFFILMALGLVGFGTVAWITTRPPAVAQAAEPVPQKKTVLVAARAVHAGSLLKPEDIAAKEFIATDPAARDGTPDSVEARRDLVGAMVRRGLAPGDVVRGGDVMRPGDHGFLAAVLMPGMRAVTISVDDTTGTAGLIWPGDRVDLILTQTIGQASVPLGRRVAAETIMANIRVLAIDQQIVQGAAPTGSDKTRTVTLEVTPEQAERISVAGRLGRLSLSVRSAEGIQQASAQPDTTWAGDVSRALGQDNGRSPDSTIRIFQGGQEPKEFKF